jgi:hypothetical protein
MEDIEELCLDLEQEEFQKTNFIYSRLTYRRCPSSDKFQKSLNQIARITRLSRVMKTYPEKQNLLNMKVRQQEIEMLLNILKMWLSIQESKRRIFSILFNWTINSR